MGAWRRVRIPDPMAASVVRRALDEVSHQMAEPRCQALLDEFRDADGRRLRERLAALGMDVRRYLDFVVFEDGSHYARCGGALAYTGARHRIVYLCVRAVERGWRENPRHLVATLIHEVLHTLGLGENPPSSAEITERVLRHCGEA